MKFKRIRLLFEQSGTFRDVFKELGYQAFDYDIENQFGQTDYQLDLFDEIHKAYREEPSVFDTFDKDDLIVAFFPCTYFSIQNELIWSRKVYNFRKWSKEKIDNYIADREREREKFYQTLLQFIEVVNRLKIKMCFENPYSNNYLLKQKEMIKPQIIISDRKIYGDYFKKPTMFYFYNFEPTIMSEYTIVNRVETKKINKLNGINRSLIHKDFAKNFIMKYILGNR